MCCIQKQINNCWWLHSANVKIPLLLINFDYLKLYWRSHCRFCRGRKADITWSFVDKNNGRSTSSCQCTNHPRMRYLFREGGISCNEYRKYTLVRLAEVAIEVQLPVIVEKNDDKVMNLKRRTIRSLSGEEIVAPHMTTIIRGFAKDL